MTMSVDAREGLRVAVASNPAGARRLLDILLTAPRWVRHKPQDRYGLLSLMIGTHPDLPETDLELCAGFHRRWIAMEFDHREVTAELFHALREIGEAPSTESVVATASGTWRVLRPGRGGESGSWTG